MIPGWPYSVAWRWSRGARRGRQCWMRCSWAGGRTWGAGNPEAPPKATAAPSLPLPRSQCGGRRQRLPPASFSPGDISDRRVSCCDLHGQPRPAGLTHEQLVGADERKRRPGRDHPTGWRGLGHRDVAARLAALPTISRAHGSTQPRSPARESAGSVVDAVTITSSTDSGVSAATQPGCPCSSASVCMWRLGDRPGDQRSSATHQAVVYLIHPSGRAVIAPTKNQLADDDSHVRTRRLAPRTPDDHSLTSQFIMGIGRTPR